MAEEIKNDVPTEIPTEVVEAPKEPNPLPATESTLELTPEPVNEPVSTEPMPVSVSETPTEPIPLEPANLQADPASNGTGKTTTDQNIPTKANEVIEAVKPNEPIQTPEIKKEEVKVEEVSTALAVKKYLLGLLNKAHIAVQVKKKKNLEKLLEYFQTHEKVRNNDVEKLLKVKDTAATNYLKILEKEGKIRHEGKGITTRYYKI